MSRRMTLLWLPLAIFIGLATAFVLGLGRPEGSIINSKLVGQPLPDFTLPSAVERTPGLASSDLKGRATLVNIFASWCVPCATEAPQLQALAMRGVPIVGIALRDRPEALRQFLDRYGNPYARIGADRSSQVQIALGSSGVPETFIVDRRGRILLQQIGPIMPADIDAIAAIVKAAQ